MCVCLFAIQGIAPIEQDIAKEKARIPRNYRKMEETKVGFDSFAGSFYLAGVWHN